VLERLKQGIIEHLNSQRDDFESDIAEGDNDDLIEDLANLQATKKTIKQAITVSGVLLPLQQHGWSLPGILDVLFKALEPGISEETVDRLIDGWDT